MIKQGPSPPLSCVKTVKEALAVCRSFLDGVVIFLYFHFDASPQLSCAYMFLLQSESHIHIYLKLLLSTA